MIALNKILTLTYMRLYYSLIEQRSKKSQFSIEVIHMWPDLDAVDPVTQTK